MGTTSETSSTELNVAARPHKLPLFRWHEPGTSKEEKILLRKIDWFILSYGCLSFFIKYLDQTNISNAYVSGMSTDLGFGPGNELSWMNTYFNIGVIIGAPISNILLTVVRPRYWLPACLFLWSIFVLFLYKSTTASQFYGLRFSIGFLESACSPGIHYIIGSWYRKSELARRSSLFVISGVLGQMFSGYLQSALYSGMNGKGGLAAWKWLFIFDFILGIPVAIYGVICFPDTPHTTQAWYLNASERKLAVARIDSEGRKPIGKLDLTVFKRILLSWQLYIFSIAYIFWSLTAGSYVMQFFQLWLKAEKTYSVVQINNIPTAIGAVNFFFMIGTGYASDVIGSRAPVTFFVGSLLTFCFIIFTVWNVPSGLKMFAFIATGCYGCFTPLMFGWVNQVCHGDSQLRAFTLAFMTSVGTAAVTPFQQYMFPSGQAPTYSGTHGYAAALVFVVCLTLWCSFVILFFQKRDERKFNSTGDDREAGSVEAPVTSEDPLSTKEADSKVVAK